MTRILKVEPMDGAEFFVPQHKTGEANALTHSLDTGWTEYIGFDPKGNIAPMAFPTKADAEAFLEHPAIYRVGEFGSVKISVLE
jgi:tricorn protease-like protein